MSVTPYYFGVPEDEQPVVHLEQEETKELNGIHRDRCDKLKAEGPTVTLEDWRAMANLEEREATELMQKHADRRTKLGLRETIIWLFQYPALDELALRETMDLWQKHQDRRAKLGLQRKTNNLGQLSAFHPAFDIMRQLASDEQRDILMNHPAFESAWEAI